VLEPRPDHRIELRPGDARGFGAFLRTRDRLELNHVVIVAWAGGGRAVEALHPLRLDPPRAEGCGDIVGDVHAAHADRFEADQHSAHEQRHVGDAAPSSTSARRVRALLSEARLARRDRRRDDGVDREVSRADAQIEVLHRRWIGGDDVDVDREPPGVEAERLPHASSPSTV
jgi:hypothetical protein